MRSLRKSCGVGCPASAPVIEPLESRRLMSALWFQGQDVHQSVNGFEITVAMDPAYNYKPMMRVQGTAGDDTIVIAEDAAVRHLYHMELNGVAASAFVDTDGLIGIAVDAGDGNDHVTVDAEMSNGSGSAGSVFRLWINGGDGDDTIVGSEGSYDQLYGGAGNDAIYGRGGHDSLYGGLGDDTLYGGAGFDDLWGGDRPGSASGDTTSPGDVFDGGADTDLYDGAEEVFPGAFDINLANGDRIYYRPY
jgi:Ca2+-binding RTX toxin-like protein